jgi:hypothetical protein
VRCQPWKSLQDGQQHERLGMLRLRCVSFFGGGTEHACVSQTMSPTVGCWTSYNG